MFKNVGAREFWVRLFSIRAIVKQYFYGMMEARRVAAEQDHEDADDWVSSMDAPSGGALLPAMVIPSQPQRQPALPQSAHHHPPSSSSAFSPSALTATSSTLRNVPLSYGGPLVPD